MVGADLRHRGSQNSQALGRAEVPTPKPSLSPSEASFATSSSTLLGVEHATNAVFQSQGLSNNAMSSATHVTQKTREYTNQSSDTAAVHKLLSKDALQDLLRSIETMDRPQSSGQPQDTSVPPAQLRKILLPCLLKNAQRRPDLNDNLVDKIEVGLRDALTDQFCDSLSQNLQAIHRKIQAMRGSKEDVHTTATAFNPPLGPATVARPDGRNSITSAPTTSSSVREIPRVPRAMRSASLARLTSDSSVSLPQIRSRDTYDFGRLSRRPSEREPPESPLSASERRFRWDHPVQKHDSNGIPIPLDSSFFTTQHTSTIGVKREYSGPSIDEGSLISRLHRSRSPHRRSLSASSRHSRYDTTHRRFSHHETSNHRHSRSPRPRSRRSRSHSQSRQAYSPSPKRRRRTFSRPPGSHRSRSRPRENSFARRQSPPAYVGRSRSPHARKPSFHTRNGSFRHSSPEPALRRRTPVELRSIDRTRPVPPPDHRDSISDRSGPSIRCVSRSPEPLSAVSNISRRHLSPSRRKLSRSPDSASYLRRLPPSSPTKSKMRSRSPVRVSFRPRLSPTPDANHPGPYIVPHTDGPERSKKTGDIVSSSVSNHVRSTPLIQGVVTVKREPDVEDFTVALHPSPSTHPSPAVVLSPHASSSSRPGYVPTNISPAPPSQVPMAATHPPPARVSPGHQSLIDKSPTVHTPGRSPDNPEEGRNFGPLFMEREADIPPSLVSSPPSVLSMPSEVFPVQLSPQKQSPVVPSLSIPSQPSEPPSSPSMPSMIAQRFPVPGLWFAKPGQDQADILDCEFEVNSEIIQRWSLPGSITSDAALGRLSFQLLCIPVEHLRDTYQTDSLDELMDSGVLTGSITSMKTVWPEQGTLLVQMNPKTPHKRVWFPRDMGPNSPSLDITDSVHEGKNVLRLIQLEDMSNKIFMLHASLLPPTSQQDSPIYWDIADSNHLATDHVSPAIVEVF